MPIKVKSIKNSLMWVFIPILFLTFFVVVIGGAAYAIHSKQPIHDCEMWGWLDRLIK